MFKLFLCFITVLPVLVFCDEEETRIVGGSNAPDGAVPYIVSISQEYGGKLHHICGGSIIDKHWILTAAHCFRQEFTPTVVAGTNNISKGGKRYKVGSIIVHEKYLKYKPEYNDIALLKLSTEIEYTEKIQPVELTTEDPKPGTVCILAGWGYVDKDRKKRATDLQIIELKTISKDCRRMSKVDRKQNICTFTKNGEGACQGDSGGPLVAKASKKQIGIVSWGVPCAYGSPDVYTSVYAYRDWINKHIKK
ncbi:unnamed protein product [Leptosia nina]|uniref:trypsin n=1 Tax=Leptosia nina TaxID=320188 RepID=A0AAV1JI78_9NEOP